MTPLLSREYFGYEGRGALNLLPKRLSVRRPHIRRTLDPQPMHFSKKLKLLSSSLVLIVAGIDPSVQSISTLFFWENLSFPFDRFREFIYMVVGIRA